MPPMPARAKSTVKSAQDKPYRRGRTLGKDSLRGRTPRALEEKERSKARGMGRSGGSGAVGRKGGAKQAGEEAEWGGIESEDEEGEEDEDEEMDVLPPAQEDGEEESAAAALPAAAGQKGKGKKERRKTGGTGKKVKTFVEGKDALLSLAASITGTAEAKKQEKLERGKQRLAKPAPPTESKELSASKQKQLAAARAIVAERAKQKKDRQKADAAPPKPAAAGDGKKRVSFA